MKNRDFFVRILGYKLDNGQWFAICLEYDLAVQGESLRDVFDKLKSQINSYVKDALVGADQDAAWWLLHRRAPLKYWVKFYYAVLTKKLFHHFPKDTKPKRQPLPMTPAIA